MAVVESNYEFVNANIGAYGKDCDSTVFQKKNLPYWKLN